jgi:ferric-dicitrate binding protein FerR (iron transport regulator)
MSAAPYLFRMFSTRDTWESLDHGTVGEFSRRAVVIGAAALAVDCNPFCAARAAAAVGRVGFAQGDAILDRDGGRITATEGAEIFLRDVAVTGDEPSRVDLRLGAAIRIRLGAKARLEISRLVPGVAAAATLQTGPALIERGPGAEPDFELKSPFALLAARGTTFFAGPSDGVFAVYVREGAVIVRTRRGTVTVRAGEGTGIKAPGAAPTPVKPWGQSRIDAALASVN